MKTEDCVRELKGVVDRVIRESGNSSGFDSERWISGWIEEPNPAFRGRRPIEMFDEPGGFERVRCLLLRIQSGAYS